MAECQDCGKRGMYLHSDPRTPPLSIDKCLCRDCYKGAAEQVLEDSLEATENAQRLVDDL